MSSHIDRSTLRANGDVGDNVFTLASSFATIANGGAGNDYYILRAGQTARVDIEDFGGSNQLYFDQGIVVTSATLSRGLMHINFSGNEGLEQTLSLRYFINYNFFIGNNQTSLSHTEFLEVAGRGFTVEDSSPLPPDSVAVPALEPTVEIRANGTIDADTFSLGL